MNTASADTAMLITASADTAVLNTASADTAVLNTASANTAAQLPSLILYKSFLKAAF